MFGRSPIQEARIRTGRGWAMSAATVLILPGLGNSGPEHWQSWLEARHPRFRRVEQRDWDRPNPADWTAAIESAVTAVSGRVVLVAHSLACIAVAHWVNHGGSADRVAAALLVAPPDVESPDRTPAEVHAFAPVPDAPLPFRAVVLASRDDPYCPIARACGFAVLWGADFIEAGDLGHINTSAGFGPWLDGERLLLDLLKDVEG